VVKEAVQSFGYSWGGLHLAAENAPLLRHESKCRGRIAKNPLGTSFKKAGTTGLKLLTLKKTEGEAMTGYGLDPGSVSEGLRGEGWG